MSGTSIKPWALAPHRRYRFVNARIVDTKDATVYQFCAIDIVDGSIKRLARHEAAAKVDEEMKKWSVAERVIVVDLEGKYVMPGLIDCHVNLALPPGESTLQDTLNQDRDVILLRQPYLLKQMLHRGFTTVRDCGGAGRALRQAIEDGTIEGPRLVIAGRAISGTGGSADIRPLGTPQALNNIGRVADGPDQCLAAARDELRQGSEFLSISMSDKMYYSTHHIMDSQYTAKEIKAFTEVATDAGTYVTAHAYTDAAIQRAVDNGVRAIEHGSFLSTETAALMAQKGAYLTPALSTSYAMAVSDFPGFIPPDITNMHAILEQSGSDAVRIAAEAGVIMTFGTDLLGPLQVKQSEEFMLLKQAGLTPAQILQSATISAARLLQRESLIGRIKEGFKADLIVLDVSPLDNIEVLSHPANHMLVIMKDGRVVKSSLTSLPEERVGS